MAKRKQNKESVSIEETGAYKYSLLVHLMELRTRLSYAVLALILGSVSAYFFVEDIYTFLSQPLVDVLQAKGGEFDTQRRMIFTSLPEVFITYIKLAFFSGLMLSFPFMAYQLWLFIAPGLYKNEKKFFLPLLVLTPVLFFSGAAFVYFFVLPLAWQFFLSFEQLGVMMPIQLEAKVSEYLSITMQLMFAFGFAFLSPIFLLILNRAGLVKRETFEQKRRYAIIVVFVLAALLTPPDIISQIALALPLLVFYEISIFFMKKG